MPDYADLEIGLHRRDVTHYAVDMRFAHPQSDADVRLVRGSDLPHTRFDDKALRQAILNHPTYGAILTQCLCADPQVPAAFTQALAMAQALDAPLRVRLFIGPSAPDLHAIHWEKLHIPDGSSQESLLTTEHILFSRYLSSSDWRPVRLRPKSDLRALVVVSNPSNVGQFAPNGDTPLHPIDVDGEIAHAQAHLGNQIAMTTLATTEKATLPTIISHLRDGYDILYLVAHGAMIEDEPCLWLEDEQGNAKVTNGRDLVQQMREMRDRPRLVVLSSCQSAMGTTNDDGTLAALGPRLAEIGIPAVLAMQANITMETTATFMPPFFAELCKDGQIDRAMAVARGAVRHRHDWWVPVLFLRFKSGSIWYQPGFGGDERKSFERWPSLVKNIQRGMCTPILGTHLSEMFGTQTEIAQRWAENHHFPMEPYRSEHLSQVAQYLAVTQQLSFPRDDLLDQMLHDLLTRYENVLATQDQHRDLLAHAHDALGDGERRELLIDLLSAVGELRRTQNEADPYRVLADLPFPVYITANFTNLLEAALRAVGKQPIIEICRWNDYIETLPSIYDTEPDYLPTIDRPMVYHLFGHLSEPDSLVITEDDYFDYLIGFSANDDLVPPPVNNAMADNGLLFLGFQPDDWDFRILFRSLAKLWVTRRRRRYINISAQIAPDETRILEPVRARRYLETYFQESHIDIYWGTVDDFAREMLDQWRKASSPAPLRRR